MVTQRPPRGDLNGQWLHDKAPGMKNMNTDSRPRGPSDIVEQSNTKLLVSNLHYEVTPKDLAAIFGQIGTLVREPLIRIAFLPTTYKSKIQLALVPHARDPRVEEAEQPKTAEDLDKELDAFMGDAESAPIAGASVEAQSLVADSAIGAVGEQDVEMA
ncbi:hypothetical protein HHX47_DHR2000967 [Lentinula edodes]|nr:hypothetical protein HHX47_DHR2000967 [Lentinula edodes]